MVESVEIDHEVEAPCPPPSEVAESTEGAGEIILQAADQPSDPQTQQPDGQKVEPEQSAPLEAPVEILEPSKEQTKKKGILKYERTYSNNKHVEFEPKIEFIPFDEEKDQTIEIQIVPEIRKVVSYRALFLQQKEEERKKKEAEEAKQKEEEEKKKKRGKRKKKKNILKVDGKGEGESEGNGEECGNSSGSEGEDEDKENEAGNNKGDDNEKTAMEVTNSIQALVLDVIKTEGENCSENFENSNEQNTESKGEVVVPQKGNDYVRKTEDIINQNTLVDGLKCSIESQQDIWKGLAKPFDISRNQNGIVANDKIINPIYDEERFVKDVDSNVNSIEDAVKTH